MLLLYYSCSHLRPYISYIHAAVLIHPAPRPLVISFSPSSHPILKSCIFFLRYRRSPYSNLLPIMMYILLNRGFPPPAFNIRAYLALFATVLYLFTQSQHHLSGGFVIISLTLFSPRTGFPCVGGSSLSCFLVWGFPDLDVAVWQRP